MSSQDASTLENGEKGITLIEFIKGRIADLKKWQIKFATI
jgi:hypothetical protein